LDSKTLACDTSLISEGQKTVVVRPSSSYFFGLAQATVKVRVLPELFVLSSRILAIGNSKFLFKITGLDPNLTHQLTCSFRSPLTSNIYLRSVDSVLGSSSVFSCSSPVIDAAGAAWTFSVSIAAANFTLVETSQILVSDLLRLDASNVDSSVGLDVPISFAFARQEPLFCKLSSPLSIISRSLELAGGAHATIHGPSSSNVHDFSIGLWIKASSAIKHDVSIPVAPFSGKSFQQKARMFIRTMALSTISAYFLTLFHLISFLKCTSGLFQCILPPI
jgi:hypothetical protein